MNQRKRKGREISIVTVLILTMALAGAPVAAAGHALGDLGLEGTTGETQIEASADATLSGGCQLECSWGGSGSHKAVAGTHGELFFNGLLKDTCDGGSQCSTGFVGEELPKGTCAQVTATTTGTGGSDTDTASNADC